MALFSGTHPYRANKGVASHPPGSAYYDKNHKKANWSLRQRDEEVNKRKNKKYVFQQICPYFTLGARDFSSAVSGFCQVFIVTRAKSFSRGFAARGFGLRPKLCRPSANTKNFHRTREKPLVPRVPIFRFENKPSSGAKRKLNIKVKVRSK